MYKDELEGLGGLNGLDERTNLFADESGVQAPGLFHDETDDTGLDGMESDYGGSPGAASFEVFSGITPIWDDLRAMASTGGLRAPSDKIEFNDKVLRYEDIVLQLERCGTSTAITPVSNPGDKFYVYTGLFPSWLEAFNPEHRIALTAAPWFGISGVLRDRMSDFLNAMNNTVELGRNIPQKAYRGDWRHFTGSSDAFMSISRIDSLSPEVIFDMLKMAGFSKCVFCRCSKTGKLAGVYEFQENSVSFWSFVYKCVLIYNIPFGPYFEPLLRSIELGKDHFEPEEYDSQELCNRYYTDVWCQLFPYLAFYGGVLCSDVFEAVRPEFESVDEEALEELARSKNYCIKLPVASTCAVEPRDRYSASIIDFCRGAIRAMQLDRRR